MKLVIGTNFSHKLLLTDTQVLRLSKSFANGSSANVKLSKSWMSKVAQLGGCFIFVFLQLMNSEKLMFKLGEKNTEKQKSYNLCFGWSL